jgi:hypothetical protein
MNKKINKTTYERELNNVEPPAHECAENGGRIHFRAGRRAYGTWLRNNDPIAFEVGYNEWMLKHGD